MNKAPLDIAQEMEAICRNIRVLCEPLNKLGLDKATAIADYEQARQVAEIRLRDEGIPVTLISSQAKGLCRAQRIASDLAETMYKIQLVKIDAAKAVLNAKQSIFRHLDNTGR